MQDYRIVRQILVDFICLAVVGCSTIVFGHIVGPYKRGFFCSDTTIRYPIKRSTIRYANVLIICYGINVHVILITELIIYPRNRNASRFSAYRIKSWLWRSYCLIQIFFFGALSCELVTSIMKVIVGRLRPYFFAECQPQVNCSSPENKYRYIESFKCLGGHPRARVSFPSGHSSMSFYCMVFLVIYLQKNFTWKGSKLLRPLFQLICILTSTSIALSRISDYKHHWSDVLVGTLIGTIFAIFVTYFVTDLFEKEPASEEEQDEEEENEYDEDGSDGKSIRTEVRSPY